MIICSIAVCTYQIYTLYSKWQSNPVIVTFDTDATSIWQIPFPAVTICPQSKSNHSKFKLAQLLNKIKYSSKERKSLYALAHVCIRRHPLFSFKNLGTPIKNQDVIKDLINIALDPMEIFKNIQIMDFFEDRKHFYEMFTNEGICFSYNLLDYKLLFNDIIDDSQQMPKHRGRFKKFTNWSLEGGYQGFSRHSYPFRALASGIKGGLSFDLKSLVADIDLICGNTVDGYKLALHTPGEFPRFEKHYIQIPFGQYVMLSVMPRVITTSEKLRNYSPHKRQCFFDGEKPLKFFKMYTQSNCELECETEYTNSVCGCVKFSMPHSNDTKVCDSKAGIKCTNEALSFFKIQNIVNILKKEEQNLNGNFVVDNFEDLEIDTFSINDSRTERQCDCLPACTSLQYDAEISQTLLNIDIMSKNGLENE